MPRSLPILGNNGKAMTRNYEMLLLSDEAIYVYQYMALEAISSKADQANDYLSEMLRYVSDNLNSLVPQYILDIETSAQKSQLVPLFTRIVQSKYTDFLEQMLLQLTNI